MNKHLVAQLPALSAVDMIPISCLSHPNDNMPCLGWKWTKSKRKKFWSQNPTCVCACACMCLRVHVCVCGEGSTKSSNFSSKQFQSILISNFKEKTAECICESKKQEILWWKKKVIQHPYPHHESFKVLVFTTKLTFSVYRANCYKRENRFFLFNNNKKSRFQSKNLELMSMRGSI